MKLSGSQSFLHGIKPAWLGTNLYEQEKINRLKADGHPHYFIDHGYGGSTIFFANEEMRSRYIVELNQVRMGSREEIILTGTYLGYPPVACQFFADARDDKGLAGKRAGFYYYGIVFAGNFDDIDKISVWLWDHIKAPLKPVEISYQGETIWIDPTVSVIAT